jgi:hypothetical protein
VLGDPDEVKDNAYIYHDDTEPALQYSTAYFFIKRGVVDKVRWEFKLD